MSELATVLGRLGPRAERDVPLGPLTTYRVGGPAAGLVRAATIADLEAVAAALAGTDVPVLVVGRGSNLLVHDEGFGGVAVVLEGGFASVVIEGTRVRAGGAASLPVVARQSAAAGLVGFEWAVGVPGSIGGAVRMNAGGHGSDMAASLVEVELVDLRGGGRSVRPVAGLGLGYRRSSLGPDEVVVSALLALDRGDPERAEAEIAQIVRWRRDNQPGGHNAGSVFVNPPGDSAGRLIDAVGGKGERLGTAEVSTKHANFIQADEGGAAADVYALMQRVRARVEAATGIALRVETRLVGFDPLDDPPTGPEPGPTRSLQEEP